MTGLALALQTGLAAIVGVIVAHEFGRDAETDGFFASFALYVVVILGAAAVRVVVQPPLARARQEGKLGVELAAYAVTIGVPSLLLLGAVAVAADPLAWLLTGAGPDEAQAAAAACLPWMLLAGVLQLYAGLAASALATLDDYVVAASGYVLGSTAGLAFVVVRVDAGGIEAVAQGMALSGALAVAVPAVALALRARAERMPRPSMRTSSMSFTARLGELGTGIAVALALQAIFFVSVPLAGREGVGAVTSFNYAYLIMAAVVAVTGTSLGLVTTVPMTRAGLDTERSVRHIVSSGWLAIVAVGAAAGVFALAGAPIVETLLGSAYGESVASDLGWLVLALTPWAVVSVGSSATFPLVFVAGRTRRLPLLALAAFAIHLPLAVAAQLTLGLAGLALALAVTTALVLGAGLVRLDALAPVARGLAYAAIVVAGLVLAAFAPPGLALGATVVAAVVGAVFYAVLCALVRPVALVEAWRYLRALA